MAENNEPGEALPGSLPQGGGRTAEDRIRQLVAQKNAANQSVAQLREEIAELRGSVQAMSGGSHSRNGSGESGALKGWADLSDSDLSTAFTTARNEGNADLEYQAVSELSRRQAERASKQHVEVQTGNFQRQRELEAVEAKVLSEFGAEAGDPESELQMRAAQYAGQYRKKYGQDVFTKTPDLLYHSFAQAHRDLSSGTSDRLRELEAENARLRSAVSMEPGGGRGIPQQSDEVKTALANRDPRAAIRALRVTRSFE